MVSGRRRSRLQNTKCHVRDSSSPPWVGGGAGRDKSQVSTDPRPSVPSCRAAAVRRLACFGLVLVASWRADMGVSGARPASWVKDMPRWLETHTDDGREGGWWGTGGANDETHGASRNLNISCSHSPPTPPSSLFCKCSVT